MLHNLSCERSSANVDGLRVATFASQRCTRSAKWIGHDNTKLRFFFFFFLVKSLDLVSGKVGRMGRDRN